ncbi:MAG: site-2 protease family protein [Candidatus Micrarchaeota archaeon]|nr:site-2 protease family protein [Candidatus Micrarchaeota archaeon]
MAVGRSVTSLEEIRDIIIADVVLITAFSLTRIGGIPGFQGNQGALGQFLYYLPIAAIGVTLSFILHELMHKFLAMRYGAAAEFRTSLSGLAVTIVTGAFGFLLGIPGATYIYTNSFTDKENGLVSIAGPLTNLAVFVVFLGIALVFSPPTNSFLYSVTSFTIFISILLAFFNMLPIYPLDGSKVLHWSKPIYAVSMLAIFALMVLFTGIGIFDIIIFVVVALVFSLFYRFVL